MSKLGTLADSLRKGGLSSALSETTQYIFAKSPAASPLKRLFGTRLYHKICFYSKVGYWPNFQNPTTFNEKINHRKLFTDKNLFSIVEDKDRARGYVREKVGDEVLPETYHLTDDPATIPFDDLPDEYVVKPTHLSGDVIIVDRGDEPERQRIKQQCKDWLDSVHGQLKDEYWYSDINPQIIIEERLRDNEYDIPPDFKFFVFHGEAKYIEVDTGRRTNHQRRFYNRYWEPQDFELKYPLGDTIPKPNQLPEMLNIAEKLGEDFDFIRVDLYSVNNDRVVFGELTVAHGSGREQFRPRRYDGELGSHW
jgi:hypothetical protein